MSVSTSQVIEMEEKEIPRVYYSTQEASAFLEIPTRTIRDWIRRFDIQCQRNSKGCARLTNKNLEALKFINNLINVEKYTFAGVEQKLKNLKDKK